MGDWREILIDEAEKRWRETGKPLFLAQIPPLLRSRGVDVGSILAGRPLRLAIEADAAGKLRLVNDPDHSPAWAVIPTFAPKDIDLHALFRKSSEAMALSASAPRPVRFRRWFWASFIKPLELEHRRWILSERFTDLPKSEEPPEEGSIEVLAAEIALTDPDAIADEAKVSESIQKWAVRTGISLDRFRDRVNENAEKITRQARMALAFESLDAEDQKRIVIPLDIVMKLLGH